MGSCGEEKEERKIKNEEKKVIKMNAQSNQNSQMKNESNNEHKQISASSDIKKETLPENKQVPVNNEEVKEIILGHKPIPIKIINKVIKSMCKITIKSERGNNFGNGFFLNYSDELKLLLTNYHVINPNLENANIEIEIHNKKVMNLELKNRFCKYIEEPNDIAIIEIKESDEIYKDIEFLDYDLIYTKNGYSIYKDVEILSIVNPNSDNFICKNGKIININK